MQALRFAAREAISDAYERGGSPGPAVGVVHSMVLGDVEHVARLLPFGRAGTVSGPASGSR